MEDTSTSVFTKEYFIHSDNTKSDVSKNKINVYISTSNPDSPHVIYLQNLFKDDLYNVNVIQFDDKNDTNLSPPISDFDQTSTKEYKKLLWVLNDATKNNPNGYVLFLKDDSVTNADEKLIYEIISSLISKNVSLTYLSKWLDICDKYEVTDVINKNGTIFTKTIGANGIQALLINKDVRNMIVNGDLKLEKNLDKSLQKAISDKKIIATTISPNLFSVNISSITNPSDYSKLQECISSDNTSDDTKTKTAAFPQVKVGIPQTTELLQGMQVKSTNNRYILIIILVILIAVLLWIIYRAMNKQK